MPKHILVPLDGSEQAALAFEFALSKFPEAKITVLYVVSPPEMGYLTGEEAWLASGTDSPFDRAIQSATAFLDEYVETGTEQDIDVRSDYAMAYERGQEARAILDYAAENEVDQIVMGSHGRTGAARVLLGSVAEKVVRRGAIPVTVVR